MSTQPLNFSELLLFPEKVLDTNSLMKILKLEKENYIEMIEQENVLQALERKRLKELRKKQKINNRNKNKR